jgi:hypothetical protein
VSGQWKDLTGNAKRADAEFVTPLNRRGQCDGVVLGDVGEVSTPVLRCQDRDIAMSGSSELDRRVEEMAAKAPTESGARSRELRARS